MSRRRSLAQLVALSSLIAMSAVAGPSPAVAGASSIATASSTRVSASASLHGRTLLVLVRLRRATTSRALSGATVRASGQVAVTGRDGRARIALPAVPRQTFTVTVAKAAFPELRLRVRPRVSST